ncbi:MBL fold metallo-hydrolase [Tissierella creatinini]|nr:MBL fold metallo-hydrolase [Tissierella creatinini]TJX69232.1 MBL fold metallo-hydrolase [Soehngenia saccharolytica]
MNILRIPAGIYAANCYLVYSEDDKAAIIVDPGGDADELIDTIETNNLHLKYIVLTHGHGDHIAAVNKIKDRFGVEVLIHEDDAEMLEEGELNLSIKMAMGNIELKSDKTIKEGDRLHFGNLEAKVIHTPGHTKGGICLLIEGSLITGDTLFKGSIGRSDLYGGDFDLLISSIKNKLLQLPDETVVYPGHGGQSTIGYEKRTNHFLR